MIYFYFYLIGALLVIFGIKVWNHNCKPKDTLDGEAQPIFAIFWPGVIVFATIGIVVWAINEGLEKMASCIKIKIDRTKKG